MKAVVVGSGNVACALAEALTRSADVRLAAVVARNARSGAELAARCGVDFVPAGRELPPADIYILAVSDRAVKELSAGLDFPAAATVAHTGGAIPLYELSDKIANRAVLYPFQTFTKGRPVDLRQVPVLIEYSTPQAARAVGRVASALSERVIRASFERRQALHLAGALACNMVNALYGAAQRIAACAGFGFDVLGPLVMETAAKAVGSGDPGAVQTGPAVRGDRPTVERHAALLERMHEEKIKDIYCKLSEEIWQTSKKS